MKNELNAPPRLSEGSDPMGTLLGKVGEPTPPPGGKDRVWRGVESELSRPRSRMPLFVGGVIAAAAVALVIVFVTREAPRLAPETPVVIPADTALFAKGETRVEGAEAKHGEVTAAESLAVIPLEQGKLSIRAKKGSPAVEIRVHGEVVFVENGFAAVVADPDGSFVLSVEQGEAFVRSQNVRVGAGERWESKKIETVAKQEAQLPAPIVKRPPLPLPLPKKQVEQKLEEQTPEIPEREEHAVVPETKAVEQPAPVPTDAQRYDAAMLLAKSDPAAALKELLALSEQRDRAELALYEAGRLQATKLRRTADAIATFRSYQQRYPNGALRAEVDVSLTEALLAAGRTDEALAQLDAFSQTSAAAERGDEVPFLRASILLAKGDCVSALPVFEQLSSGKSRFAEKALYLSAQCESQLGHPDAARRALETYLQRYPSGIWRKAAEKALSGEKL